MFLLMLTTLRRSRAMALALMLLGPGISGSAVQWLHACPAEAAAVPDHPHQNPDSSQQGHSQACQCIGSCNTAPAIALTESLTVLAVVVQPDRTISSPTGHSFVPAGSVSHLLPPATAPPLV